MKLQELLTARGIDLKRTKLIRHNLSSEEISKNYNQGQLENYQKVQRLFRFKNCEIVLSFLGEEGTNGVFIGCYTVNGFTPFNPSALPDTVSFSDMESTKDCVIFNLEKNDILAEMQNRLVIDWGKGTINWCQNGTTEKEILEIRPAVSDISFTSYDKVILSYETLRKIVYNKAAYKEWEDKLSAVAGVYLWLCQRHGGWYLGQMEPVCPDKTRRQ